MLFKALRNGMKKNTGDDGTPYQIMRRAVFLNWAKSHREILYNSDYYPKYFYYKYDIEDCPKYHKSLVKQGYLDKPSLADYLQSCKVSDLKNILDNLELPKSGKKADMISRILENANEHQLQKLEKNINGYSLTVKGHDYIHKYSEYIELHKCTFEISLNEYEAMKQKLGPDKPWQYSDIIWGILNYRGIKYQRKKENGLLRNNFYYKYKHLKRACPEEAYLMLMIVRLIDYEDDMKVPGIISELLTEKQYFSEDMIPLCYRHFRGKSNPRDFFNTLKNELEIQP